MIRRINSVMHYIYSFEKLDAWKLSRKVASTTYQVTKTFPSEEKYGLVQQTRRAILSVSSNVAEGSSRKTSKDQGHFYTMAYSSLMEVLNQLIFALDQHWIKEEDYEDLRNEISKLSYMINSLRKSLNL
jgi:four helix bundle protein